MIDLSNLESVVHSAVNDALAPTRTIRARLENGLKKQKDIIGQHKERYSDLVQKLSQGENVVSKLKNETDLEKEDEIKNKNLLNAYIVFILAGA